MTNFDDLALAYDDAIDWPARLKREMPFILEAFPLSLGNRILDMACGTGRHAVTLAEKGYSVEAFDTSKIMIETARNHAVQQSVSVAFSVGDMLEISDKYSGPFEGILCLGNSLALLPQISDLYQVLLNVAALLSDSGSFVFQTLNFEEIELTGFTTFDTKEGIMRTGEEVVFNRRFEHPTDESDTTTLILTTMIKENGEWVRTQTRQNVLRLNLALITELLNQAELNRFEVFSSYDHKPFERKSSRNIIIHAQPQI